MSGAKHVWSKVHGPAAALIATLARLGWHVNSATQLTSEDGTTVNLALDSPAFVKGEVTNAVGKWRWRNVESSFSALRNASTGVGAWWKPVLAVLRQPNSEGWGYPQKAALKSAIMGRQWPQQRLTEAKLVDDSRCQLCKDGPQGPARLVARKAPPG